MAENRNDQTNIKSGSRVEKSAGSKTVSTTSNTVSRSSTSKSSASKSSTGRPSAGRSSVSKSSTGRPSASRSSASKSSTGRPSASRSSASKSSTGRSSASKSSTSGRNHANAHRRKKRRGLTGTQLSLIAALIFGILMAVIISIIMRGSLLSTTQIAGEYYLDTHFNINNFVETKNEKAYLIFDNESFHPESIGPYEINYTVQCGKLKAKKKITIQVVDADTPLISGPDELYVLLGEEIHWADYYQVIDSQPGLEESIVSSVTIDTTQTGRQPTTLRVVDWYNNSSTKDIMVIIKNLQETSYYAAKAARQYKKDIGISTHASKLYVYTSKENVTYVLADSNVIYTFDEDGNCSAYEYDIDNETEVAAFQELVIVIKTDGESVAASSIADFM